MYLTVNNFQERAVIVKQIQTRLLFCRYKIRNLDPVIAANRRSARSAPTSDPKPRITNFQLAPKTCELSLSLIFASCLLLRVVAVPLQNPLALQFFFDLLCCFGFHKHIVETLFCSKSLQNLRSHSKTILRNPGQFFESSAK